MRSVAPIAIVMSLWPSAAIAGESGCDVKALRTSFEQQMKRYLAAGQSPKARQALLKRIGADDARCGQRSAYLELKATYLSMAGEHEAALATIASVPDLQIDDPTHFGNRLRRRYQSDPDAALSMLRRALGGEARWLERRAIRWLHEELALEYAPRITARVQHEGHQRFLEALTDPTHRRLAEATAGLRLWVRALRAPPDTAQRNALADESARIQAPDAEMSRYRLLLATLLEQTSESAARAVVLREAAIRELKAISDDEVRPQDRYRLAYAHYALGLSSGDTARARSELAAAAAAAPSWSELASLNYEDRCLGAPLDLEWASAEALAAAGAADEALTAAARVAIEDAARLPAVRAMHAKARPRQSFAEFWSEELARLPEAPAFEPRDIEGKRVSIGALRGRWVLLDFWGTWCEPCVEEMPQIEALHKDLLAETQSGAVVLTIACGDDRSAVRAFMRRNRYSFPVAMGDDDAEELFDVACFPSRRLMTPAGRLIVLRGNWLDTFRAHVSGPTAPSSPAPRPAP